MVEERRRARAACDLEGNRAGLGCLEHLGNALSFAVGSRSGLSECIHVASSRSTSVITSCPLERAMIIQPVCVSVCALMRHGLISH